MTATRSRAARRNGKRQKRSRRLLNLIIPLLLILALGGGLAFAKHSGWFPTASNTKKTTTTPSSTTENPAPTASSETPASSAEEITWEHQDTPVQVPILMYHAIHDMVAGEEANANLIVSPAEFESQLQALQAAGYYTLSPEETYKVLTENVLPQGKKVVWLTFDDSMVDFYYQAYPLLKQYGMKATNNVITGFTEEGRQGNLSVDQMKEMMQVGFSFQDHTVTHPDLEQSDVESQTYQLQASKQFLDTQLNQNTIAVAYPAGRYSQDTLTIAESLGYKLGVTTNYGLASAANGLLTLNRIRMLPGMTGDDLLAAIAQ